MDVKKPQITNTTTTPPGACLCKKCGWPYTNTHPSSKLRKAHKKICGTIPGYTLEMGSEDDEKEKTPSPNKVGGMRGSFSRSEDEVFSDAVTEFSDSGSKTMDKDLFFSFKDSDNDEISEVDTSVEVSEKIDTHVEKIGESKITTASDLSESNVELTETSLVKDGVPGHTPEPSHILRSQETKSVDVLETREEKGQETKEAKDPELTKRSTEMSAIADEDHVNVKQVNFEKLESSITDGNSEIMKHEIISDRDHVREVVNEYESVEETNIEKFELESETAPEVVKESETDHLKGVAEEVKFENFESDHKDVPEVASESASVQSVSFPIEEEDFGAPNVQVQEVSKEPIAVLTEEKDIEAHGLENNLIEHIQQASKEPNTVLTEKEDHGGSHMEKDLNKPTQEVIEKPVSVFIEKQDLSKLDLEKSSSEQIQEVVKQPDTVLTELEDLGGAHLEEQLNEHNHEVVEQADPVLTESQDLGAPELEKRSKEDVQDASLILTEKMDLGASKLVKCSKDEDEVIEQKVDKDSSVVADVVNGNGKNASDVVHVQHIEGKINNQDSGAALSVGSSSRSSLEGNWGSVSVLSTASMDGGTEKSKVNSGKLNAVTADAFQLPSLMTLVERESKDEKPESSNVSQKQSNSEVSQGGRKRNEEVIAKVTNWSTGKHSTRLMNLLGSHHEPAVQKDEVIVNSSVNADVSSPPRMINDDKKGRKKVKGLSSWVPFVCCSSVNVVN